MPMSKYVKKLKEVTAYRLTKPRGNYRTAAILVDKPNDGAQHISLGLAVIDPKSEIPYHIHENEEEVMYIFKGHGKAIIEDKEYDLPENSAMFCPPKIRHQIINPSDQELWFIFAYGPPGAEQTIRTRGEPTTLEKR